MYRPLVNIKKISIFNFETSRRQFLRGFQCNSILSGSLDSHCPYLLSSKTTAKGTGLGELAGKENPVELDS